MRYLAAFVLVAWSAAPAAVQPEPAVQITLERTVCFGTCPVYIVTLDSDGSVRYEGRQHVRIAGNQTWTIDPAAVQALAREMEHAGFFDWKSQYTGGMTDLPTTYTTLTIGSRTKRITDYFGAPAALKEIEARIDTVSGARGYATISADAIREMRAHGWLASGDDAVRWMNEALYRGEVATVKALLDAGMNARAADDDGVTLVMKAAMSGDPETVRAILAAGGDPTARDVHGRNAADRAREAMNPSVPSLFTTVEATGRPRDYALILKLLTDE